MKTLILVYNLNDMKVLNIIFEILNIGLMLHGIYFTAFVIYGLFRKKIVYPEAEKLRRFAVLIPARNEEAVIGPLIDSIKAADYPAELIDICAIINNCTDASLDVARSHGALILECNVPVRTKGEVLKYAFRELSGREDIDAFAIFDADNLAGAEFFKEINKALDSGGAVVQGLRLDKNPRPTWVSEAYEIYYAFQNAFYNHPRAAAGMNASISGTGWAVSARCIKEHGFDVSTIAEDFEYVNLMALADEKIAYCPDALSFDEFTSKFKLSLIQRVRWSVGMLQCFKRFELRLLKKALRGSFQALDAAHMCFVPIAMLAGIIIPPFVYFALDIPGGFISYLLSLLAILYLILSFSASIAVVKSGIGLKGRLKGILGFPLFILSWVPIMMLCLFKRDIVWTPIKHDKAIMIEDIEGPAGQMKGDS